MHNAQDALALRYQPKDYIFAQSIFVISKFKLKSLAVIMKADWKHCCWFFFGTPMMTILYVEDTKQMKSQFRHSKTIPPLRCHIYAFIMCLNKFHVCTSESEQNTKKCQWKPKSQPHTEIIKTRNLIFICAYCWICEKPVNCFTLCA